MRLNPMNTKILIRKLLVPATVAMAGAVNPLGAQVTPPTPPAPVIRAPRPPRPPRPPQAWFGSGDGVTRIDTILPFSANGSVDVSLIAGAMKITTWNQNQVKVVASTTGDPSLQFDVSGSHLSLEQSGRRNGNRNVGTATYDIVVPAGTRATLSAVSGSVDASGLKGSVEINVVSGRVDVRDLGSSLSVEGVSGDIVANHVASDVRVQNVSGRLTVTSVGGTLNAETVSGGVTARGVGGDRVHITTVSGTIDFTGAPTRSARYDFETHSGRTDIRLASNASALVGVETFSGSVTNDYPGAVRRRNSDPDDDRTNYEYIIGHGDARVRAQTFSGSVHITQGNP